MHLYMAISQYDNIHHFQIKTRDRWGQKNIETLNKSLQMLCCQ